MGSESYESRAERAIKEAHSAAYRDGAFIALGKGIVFALLEIAEALRGSRGERFNG